MKLRNICIVALAAVIAAPAMANSTVDLGTIYSTGISSGDAWNAGDVLTDTYTFNVASGTSTFQFTLTDNGAIKGLTGSIYRLDNPATAVATLGTYNKAGAGGLSNLGSLASGDYQLVVKGTQITNPLGKLNPTGSYSLTLQSNVAAPVPGPAGFLVAGAGALVVAARRRRAQRLTAQTA